MILAWILWACQSPVPKDNTAELYAEAVRAATLQQGVESCEEIEADTTRHECLAFLAQAHGRTDPSATERVCSELPPSIWRDECYFLLSEAISAPETPAPGAEICRKAGRYRQPCFMHLFSGHVGFLRATHSLDEAMTRYARAIELGQSDAPKDFEHQAWSLFFRKPDHVVIDIQSCSELGESKTKCIRGAREALRRRLNQSAQKNGEWRAICQGEPTAEAQADRLNTALHIQIVPHPLLDLPIASFRNARCRAPSPRSP